MYTIHFRKLVDELSNTNNIELTRIAAGGGWRKGLIDQGSQWPSSWMDFSSMLGWILARLVWCLPPVGAEFRRALVAQDILNRKASVW